MGFGRENSNRNLNFMKLSKRQTKGAVGEDFVGHELHHLKSIMFMRFLDDIHIPAINPGGASPQCDFVVISEKGFWVIDAKNWYCQRVICGKDTEFYWTADYSTANSELYKKVQNPLIQNRWHASRLSAVIGERFESLVVFTGGAKLEDSPSDEIIKLEQLEVYFKSLPIIYDREKVIQVSHDVYKVDTGEF